MEPLSPSLGRFFWAEEAFRKSEEAFRADNLLISFRF
jgi:hypothetical protein